MSTRFTIHCNTHDVYGPHIRRHHRGAFLLARDTPRFFLNEVNEQDASDDWGAFLIEHEFCDIRLRYEQSRRPEPPPPARQPDMTLEEFVAQPE